MTQSIKPNGLLKRFIKSYFIVEFNNKIDFLPHERVFPNGTISLVLHYGPPSKFKKKNEKEYVEPNIVICGQQTSFYDISLSGETGMILVLFQPHGLRAFFNFPINELLNQNLALNHFIKEVPELEDKLLNTYNNRQRIELIEDFFIKRLGINQNTDRIEHALKIIEVTKGQIRTQHLAQEVCLGIKQFERIFSANVGLSPKKYMSIVRFQNTIRSKQNSKFKNLNQLAAESGYYDQSHFNHEFKQLTGLTPRSFFNKPQ